MEREDYFNMVEKALTTLKPTRRSFYDIWCYISDHFRIKERTKAYRNVKEVLKSGVKDRKIQEYRCRGKIRFMLNIKRKKTTTKCRPKTGKETIKMPKERGTGVDKRNGKRKTSSPTSRPDKMIKRQAVSCKLAAAINKTNTRCSPIKKKETIKTPKERGTDGIKSSQTFGTPDICRPVHRKAPSSTTRSRKTIKSQTVSSKSATAIEETQSGSRDSPALVLHRSFTVKLPDDRLDSFISSIDVTPDGRILVVDRRIKLFDKDGKILDTLKINLFNGPDIVAVISNNEAVCTVKPDSEIYILDIKDNKLAFRDTIRVIPRSWVSDISVHGDKFIVANGTRPMSIQLIDRQGNVYWSTQRDDNGESLVRNQILLRLTSFIEEGKMKVVVVDVRGNRLVKLEGDNGKVVKIAKLFDKPLMAPAEITHDGKNRLYVSNSLNGEIYAWNYELTESTVVLSKAKGLCDDPLSLKYDASNDQLLVSYGHNNSNVIDIFRTV